MYFDKRLLKYETASNNNNNLDYGSVSQIITDKLVNVNMGGSSYTLESVQVDSGYIPKLGDWVVIEWQNGNPIAKGSNGTVGGNGLIDINAPTIVSQNDLASGTINGDHIRYNSIDADHIQAGAITVDHISANTITAQMIQVNAVQTQHISANSVTGDKIDANTITGQNIKAGSIDGTSISANSIGTVHLEASSVTAQQISANAVQTQHISANSIIASQIKADQINSTHISANSITSDEIVANAVQTQHISANSVTATQISANAVQTQHISANSINSSQIQANAITSSLITANAITAQHLSANSVTATAISANAVQTQHISANTITSSQIKANSITSSLISANSVLASHISANQINATHLSANSVTAVAISANSVQTQHISANSILGYMVQSNQVSANHITANAIGANHITANAINATHISANQVTAIAISSNSIQARHISSNSIQANMISANQVNATHISANSVLSNMISANQVQAQHISANSVQTQHVSANSIYGYQISANQISGNHIVAGSINTDHLSVGTVQQGLLGQYYTYSAGATNKFQTFKGSQVDATINFSWGSGSPTIVGQSDNFAVRWQGFIQAPETGSYTFITVNDDTMKVVVNNTQVINSGYVSGNEVSGSAITLTANNWYPILVEMTEGTGNATAILKWVRPSLTKEVIPQKYFTQGNTQIDGAQIMTGTITAGNIQVGTITADSGIIATAAIKTANIASGNITSALIGYGEVKTANIASGNITNALIADATIDHAKIASVDASTITVGHLDGSIITAGTISGGAITAQSITGDRIKAGAIDTTQLKAGSVITDTIASGAITTDKIEAGAVTGDIIRAGSITAEHISTVGLDAQLVQVYNSATGETLIGSGYLRVDGLDVGVIQSDNLLQNGLFLASSSDYGFKRMNPSGEALLGNTVTGVGSHQIWKIDLTSGNVVKTIDIPAKKPFDIGIHPTGNYAYITVQGDNTLVQLDLVQDALTTSKLNMGMGPARIKWRDMQMENMDMKHFFVLNTDPDSMFIPDSLMVVDTPPSSVNGDLYVHHEIALGINPYDFVTNDSNKMTYVTMASQGDVVVIDTTDSNSFNWKVKGRLPISAFGTDNNHGDLPSQFGMNEVLGGDASSQYNNNSMGTMSGMGGMDSMSGYGASDGSLRKYEPHGIALSSDPNTLYVVDYANGELVVVDINGNAPYNYLVGTTAEGSFVGSSSTQMGSMTMTSGSMGGMISGTSPASLASNGEVAGGGPGTYYVRYRIPVGDSPDFIQVANGKIFITLEGSNSIAVIDESAILNEINADNSYYGTRTSNGSFTNWNTSQPMRTVNQPTVRMVMGIGSSPSFMKTDSMGMNLYVSVSGDNQIAVVDTGMEMVTKTINVGTNPKGFDITPDGKYLYVANYGGIGDLSFIYPQGTYIGDPYMALEGGIMYQGADGWTPDRSDWVFDASGNIQSKSTVEFHINEPLKNEGGYAKLTAYGIDSQYAQIEQDIINVENYSNGNNVVVVTGGRLAGNYDSTVWTPKEGAFISGTVHNVKIGSIVSGNTVLTSANSFSVNYNLNQVIFSANVVGSGNWVQADYTAPNNIYFKTHNSSLEIAVDNGSSPNFATSFQVDEFVPNFVAVDNRQTSSFTPTQDGINDTYEGLYYSVDTNRAVGTTVTTSVTPISGSASKVTDGYEPDEVEGDVTMNPAPPTDGSVTLPSGNQWVKVDLGNVYMIGQISVAHSYGLDRTYHKTKTEVSEDGVTWTTIYDSAVSGEYSEKPYYHTQHGHTHYAHFFTFNALPVRYIRDWANGWTSGDGLTSGSTSDWTEIKAYGDWQVEKGYVYPSNSTQAGKQIATNGIGFVSTDISKAYIAMNVQINFTSWWWMTYIVGPDFGRIKIEMPTLMNSGHFLNQQAPFVNNVAHRHIMSFPPSAMVQADSMNNIEAGKHRVIIRQDSGKVTLDRLRFDDFQFYQRSTLSIPSQSSPATFTRYKVIAEQAKWYQGQGRQATEGAYDTVRTNPDTGQPDYSVPLKYRVRVLAQLSPTGSVQERGTIYVTSAIFETGKQSTHWRRSEASDVFAGNRIETWNPSQPMNTGIQSAHLADGAVHSSKILPNAVYDYHISNYARIQEHKLELNYPTHNHTNKTFLDTMTGFAGTSGNYGTGNTVARGDHNHDSQYLNLSGGQITNTLNTKSIYTNGNLTVTGNITVTGTVDGVDVSVLSSNVGTISGNLYSHIGSGGSAHALATTGSAGFLSSGDFSKLQGISANAINQAYADTRYLQLAGGNLTNTLNAKAINTSGNISVTGNIIVTGTVDGVDISVLSGNVSTLSGNIVTLSGNLVTVSGNLNTTNSNVSTLSGNINTVSSNLSTLSGNVNVLSGNIATLSGNLNTTNNNVSALSGNIVTISGNLNTTNSNVSTLSGNIVTVSGNLNTTNNNLSSLSGSVAMISGNLNTTNSNLSSLSGSVVTISGNLNTANSNITTLSGNIVTLSGNLNTTNSNLATLSGNHATLSGNLNTTNSNLSSLSGSVVTISGNLNTTTSNLSTLSGNVVTLSGNLVTVSGNLNTTNSNLSSLSGSVVAISGNLNTTNNNLSSLSGSVSTISGNLNTANNNISTLSGNIVAVSGNLNTTNNNLSTLSGNHATLSGNLNTTNSNLSTLSGNVSSLSGSLATVSGNLNTTNSNVSTLSGNLVTVSGNLNTTNSNVSTLSGNIVTVSGNLSTTNSNVSTISGNLYNHIGSGNTAHPVAISGGVAGFIDGTNYAKLLNIQANAINQTTADGRYIQLNGSTSTLNVTGGSGALSLKAYGTSNDHVYIQLFARSGNTGRSGWVGYGSNGTTVLSFANEISGGNINLSTTGTGVAQINGSTIWYSGNLSDPATKTWISGNYYNSQSIDTKLQSKGDVFLANANTFTNTNTFTTAGLGIKIQPSGSVANTTKLLQVNNTGGTELFSVNYSGGVVVAGDLVVTGQTKYAGTTSVNGDYNISGNLYVSGNSTLGNVNTDTTTINGTMVVNGSIQEVGAYGQVHRRPLYGIAGDLQFQTDSTSFDTIVDFYDLSAYALPTVQTGATRYYQLYVVYGDDITSTQASGGQKATIRISGNTTKDLMLPYTWSSPNGRRDWYSDYFTDLPTGNGNLQAMLTQSGNSLGIRWVELIAYDKF